ncbi:hypothetical protein AAVH_39849, partial [Aphelenchoides avenae]
MTSNGFFKKSNRAFNYATLSLMCTFIHLNFVVLCTQFYFRYRYVCFPERKYTRGVIVKGIVVPALWCLYEAFVSMGFVYRPAGYDPEGWEGLRNNSWPYDPEDPPYMWGCAP